MRRRGVPILIASCVVFGCKHDKPRAAIGTAAELGVRATQLGCDLHPTAGGEPGCREWIGPCNCALAVHVRGDLTGAADGVNEGVNLLEIELTDCPTGHGIDRVLALIDPMLAEPERTAVRALVATSPPTPPGFTASVSRTIGWLRIGANWWSRQWTDVPDTSVDRAYAEQNFTVIVRPSYGLVEPDEDQVRPHEIIDDAPLPCRDHTLRPWEHAESPPPHGE